MTFKRGFNDGLPIGLGYLSVSFSFGILAITNGLSWWQAVLISLSCVTSAGQVAGVGIMAASGTLVEMAVAQLVINMRYSLMSISLSQKTDKTFNTPGRLITAFFITDEIFGVASAKDEDVSRNYFLGLAVLPVLGWTLGTLLGAVCGNILPEILTESLAIGIYGMFVAIVIPASRKNKAIAVVSFISVVLSVVCYYTPVLHENISSGFTIIICSVIAALIGVFALPIEEKAQGGAESE